MKSLIAIDQASIWHPFTSLSASEELPLIVRGEGVYLITSDGRRIIDGVSSWWVNLHGHSNPTIAKAIAEQATKLEHVIFAGFTHEPAIRLSENLLRILPGPQHKIFFSDNGSTAVEVALKLAFQYWHNLGTPRKKVIAIKGAYHGDTFGAMSIAERGLFTKPFFPFLFETEFVDFPQAENEESVKKQFEELAGRGDIAAFIFEPLVQGASGMRMYSAGTLNHLIAHAQELGILCIADEVFTGFGRTGNYFAMDHLASKPDIIALSKGLTGGFMPLGVTACNGKVTEAFNDPSPDKTFFHGHSYTANPIACAAANASFDLLTAPACRESILRIQQMHKGFADSIRSHRMIADVRVQGTILAVELETPEKTDYLNSMRVKIYPYFLDKNILLRPLGNVIYVLPPYVITNEELTYVYKAIEDFLEKGL